MRVSFEQRQVDSQLSAPFPLAQTPVTSSEPAFSDVARRVKSWRKLRVLVVDEDVGARREAMTMLRSLDCLVEGVGSAGSAIEFLRFSSFNPDAVVSDVRMREMSGWDLLEVIRVLPLPQPAFVMCSAGPFRQRASYRRQADAVLGKPFAARDLSTALRTAVRARSRVER